MATNKNQHFVPRCYLRPFTINSACKAINLYNIDRKMFIEDAAVSKQCSKNYFYGDNPIFEGALQFSEGYYASVVREVLSPGYHLTDMHRHFFQHFWLLQYFRTEAASKRAVEVHEKMGETIGLDAREFRLNIKDAVQMSMRIFAENMHMVDDMKICLIKNRTKIPFITSDDPAVLTNRWYLEDDRTRSRSFGLSSSGDLMLLPISPSVLCLGYDGHVYNVPHTHGWVDVRRDADIHAFNEHQFLNCRANIFVHDANDAQIVRDAFELVEKHRPPSRHIIRYAVLDKVEGDYKRYRFIEREKAGKHREALVQWQSINAHPSSWPRQIHWRDNGIAYTNGSAVGYVRPAVADVETQSSGRYFQRVRTR